MKWEPEKEIKQFKYGKKSLPLGRLLREKLSSELGHEGKHLREVYDWQQELFEKLEGGIFIDEIMKEMERDLARFSGRYKFFNKKRRNV